MSGSRDGGGRRPRRVLHAAADVDFRERVALFHALDEAFAFPLGAGGDAASAHYDEVCVVVALGARPPGGKAIGFHLQGFSPVESASERFKAYFHVADYTILRPSFKVAPVFLV